MRYKLLQKYLEEASSFGKRYPVSWFSLWKYFFIWSESLQSGRTALEDEKPWMVFGAIDFLDSILTKDMTVFEYGSGGSTVFFAQRVKQVFSVEHDPRWFEKVSEKINQLGYRNWQGELVLPTVGNTDTNKRIEEADDYASDDENFLGYSFKNYASVIDSHPDDSFDLVVIDGRARPSCCKHALSKIKRGGYLLWDNTDRLYYQEMMNKISPDFCMIDFAGPTSYAATFTRTTIWTRSGI